MDRSPRQQAAYDRLIAISISEPNALLSMDLYQATGWEKDDYVWVEKEYTRIDKNNNCHVVRRFNDEKNIAIFRDLEFPKHPEHREFREQAKRRKIKKALEKRINDYNNRSKEKPKFSLVNN